MRRMSCVTGTRLLVQNRASEEWAKAPCVLGIDEAGRGPVLGPMVYACAYTPLADDASGDLKKKNFDDSKQLTEAKRESLFAGITADSRIGYVADILSAQFISCGMLAKNKISLNKIAEDSTCRIIQHVLDAGVNLTEVFVDTVGDADRYNRTLSQRFSSLKFTVCPKADALFPIVSAASIVAKVIRDKSLVETQQELGLPGGMGTGYPHDAATVAWLKANLHPLTGFPDLVRFSWETSTRMLQERGAVVMAFEADSDAGPGDGAGQQRVSFGSSSSSAALVQTSGVGRHMYFKTRKLQRVAEAF